MSLENKNDIVIALSQQRAVVLYEFLEELDKKDIFERDCDKQIVWDLICDIEKQSNLLLNSPNYAEELSKARKMVVKGKR